MYSDNGIAQRARERERKIHFMLARFLNWHRGENQIKLQWNKQSIYNNCTGKHKLTLSSAWVIVYICKKKKPQKRNKSAKEIKRHFIIHWKNKSFPRRASKKKRDRHCGAKQKKSCLTTWLVDAFEAQSIFFSSILCSFIEDEEKKC